MYGFQCVFRRKTSSQQSKTDLLILSIEGKKVGLRDRRTDSESFDRSTEGGV